MDEVRIPRPTVSGTPPLGEAIDERGARGECPACGGTGYQQIDAEYRPTAGLLTVIEGPCGACRATGEVFLYRSGEGGA